MFNEAMRTGEMMLERSRVHDNEQFATHTDLDPSQDVPKQGKRSLLSLHDQVGLENCLI